MRSTLEGPFLRRFVARQHPLIEQRLEEILVDIENQRSPP